MNQQKMTRLAQTQTCEVHPGRFNITCSAQPVFPCSWGDKGGGRPHTPLRPAMTKPQSSCHVWRTPAAEGPTRGACNPHQPWMPWHGGNCQMPAWKLREEERMAGCISLLLPLGDSSSPCHFLTRLKYIPVSLRLFALSPYPKRWPNLDKRDAFAVLGPSGREGLVAPRQSNTPSLGILIFFPSAKTTAGAAIAPHKMSAMVAHLHCKMAAGSF